MRVQTLFVNFDSFKKALNDDIKEVIINADEYNKIIMKYAKLCWTNNFKYSQVMNSLINILIFLRNKQTSPN